jgi:hypothetical protein
MLTRLGTIRVLVGILLLVRTTPLFFLVPGLVRHHGGPLLGWPDGELHAAYGGLTFPPALTKTLVVFRMIGVVLFLLGVHARVAGIAVAVLGYLVWSQEPFSFIFTLHTLYLATAILALTDAVAARALRPARVLSLETSVALVRAFVLSIYAWSAIAKLRGQWLDGSVLRVLRDGGFVSGPIARHVLATDLGLHVAAWATPLVELSLVPLLALRRTRAIGVALACVLHGVFEISMHPDVFGWLLVSLLVAFWPEKNEKKDKKKEASSHLPAMG